MLCLYDSLCNDILKIMFFWYVQLYSMVARQKRFWGNVLSTASRSEWSLD
jgi:hypothetical protein